MDMSGYWIVQCHSLRCSQAFADPMLAVEVWNTRHADLAPSAPPAAPSIQPIDDSQKNVGVSVCKHSSFPAGQECPICAPSAKSPAREWYEIHNRFGDIVSATRFDSLEAAEEEAENIGFKGTQDRIVHVREVQPATRGEVSLQALEWVRYHGKHSNNIDSDIYADEILSALVSKPERSQQIEGGTKDLPVLGERCRPPIAESTGVSQDAKPAAEIIPGKREEDVQAELKKLIEFLPRYALGLDGKMHKMGDTCTSDWHPEYLDIADVRHALSESEKAKSI